ncbi:MAG: S-formylglutathione hydrolase [Bdellovibrionia bacterium]
MANSLEQTRSHKQFEGYTNYYSHPSTSCDGTMKFTIYLPPQALQAGGKKLPVLYWLSGLTCTEETFMAEGGGAQAYARQHGIILVAPDTSPRDTGIPGENDSYDLGSGASFYVNATEPKWSRHYQMETYVTQELRKIVEENFPADPHRQGIMGHSMGGHGALVLGLRHPDLYRSISAFAPICAPSLCPWGIKAFTEYLGDDRKRWAQYDANELIQNAKSSTPILIDQGLNDEFFSTELFTDTFEETVKKTRYPAQIRRHADYDHSYYFISTFIESHIAYHAKILKS